MDIFSVSLLESFYIIYSMNFFLTKYNFAQSNLFQEWFLYHPVDKNISPVGWFVGSAVMSVGKLYFFSEAY